MKIVCNSCKKETTIKGNIPKEFHEDFICHECYEARKKLQSKNSRFNTLIKHPQLIISQKVDEAIRDNELYRILSVYKIKVDVGKIKKILGAVYGSLNISFVSKDLMKLITGNKPSPQSKIISDSYRQAIGRLEKLLKNTKILSRNKEIILQDIQFLEDRINKGWVGDAIYETSIPKKMTTEQLYQFQAILIYSYINNMCLDLKNKDDLKIKDAQLQLFISDIFQQQYRDEKINTKQIKLYLDNKSNLSQDNKNHLIHLAQNLSIPSPF
jgi:hypothetical protein